MQFFLGLLTAVVFFVCLLTAYWLGRRSKHVPVKKPPDEEKQREIERLNKHFQALWNYDVGTALKRKVK